jgi:hypothetical protein
MIGLLFLIWFLYLMFGIFWLNYTVQKNIVEEYNVIGSLIIVTVWPIHMFYTKFKK